MGERVPEATKGDGSGSTSRTSPQVFLADVLQAFQNNYFWGRRTMQGVMTVLPDRRWKVCADSREGKLSHRRSHLA